MIKRLMIRSNVYSSGPARALGIEMLVLISVAVLSMSGPARALGIEIQIFSSIAPPLTSGPARALGIEMSPYSPHPVR